MSEFCVWRVSRLPARLDALMSTLSPTNAAYFVGIVDGEGTITLTRLHRSENRRVVLSVSSTERALLEYLQCTARVGNITKNKDSLGAPRTRLCVVGARPPGVEPACPDRAIPSHLQVPAGAARAGRLCPTDAAQRQISSRPAGRAAPVRSSAAFDDGSKLKREPLPPPSIVRS
jgi:hypothetical protein